MMMHFIKYSFFLLFLGLVGCSSSPTTIIPTLLPPLQARPHFVIEVAPKEGLILPLTIFNASNEQAISDIRILSSFENVSAYDSFICLRVKDIAQDGDDFTQPTIVASRVKMFIDSYQIKTVYVNQSDLSLTSVTDINTGQVIMRGIDPKIICGQVDLAPGVHGVFFQFRQTSGDVLEYRWQFELVED
ncbi:MAG: hypothetical protein KJ063_25650 [Anaerolineae bacterium]|nr:hypothetical protein [Anaerolineae bacterium]